VADWRCLWCSADGDGHCGGSVPGCRCRCTAGPARLADGLLEFANRALAEARQREAYAVHYADQVQADMAVRVAQLNCLRCTGDLDAANILASVGTGTCTCLLRCRREGCLASENGEPLD